MMTFTLDDTLTTHFQAIAAHHQTSVEDVVNEALQEYLEDYLDVLTAQQVLADIASGKEQVISLEEAEKMLNELVR